MFSLFLWVEIFSFQSNRKGNPITFIHLIKGNINFSFIIHHYTKIPYLSFITTFFLSLSSSPQNSNNLKLLIKGFQYFPYQGLSNISLMGKSSNRNWCNTFPSIWCSVNGICNSEPNYINKQNGLSCAKKSTAWAKYLLDICAMHHIQRLLTILDCDYIVSFS